MPCYIINGEHLARCEGDVQDIIMFNGDSHYHRVDKQGRIIDVTTLSVFYIDSAGIKYITPSSTKQKLACKFDDQLVKINGQWRVKTAAETSANNTEHIRHLRRTAYMAEADPLRAEWEFDRLTNREGINIDDKQKAWINKVNEIKARYPFPE